jgi:uncharacterized protein (TIGR01244 family)
MRINLAIISLLLTLAACSEQSDGTSLTPYLAMTSAEDAEKAAAKENKMFRKVEDNLLVSPQISVADVAAAKQMGVTMIINNRPDGEEPDAPQGEEIEAAARSAGIGYVSIPVTHAGFSRPQIDAMQAALEKAEGGKVLAYCRSGTRSTLLWALSEAATGESPRVIAAKAADAGYDVAPIAMMLDTLAGAAAKSE